MSTADWSESAQPGLALHGWESSWASIEEDADGDPDAALSQFADLVERLGEEPEIVATYFAAREAAERAELGGASRSEVELAIEDLRAVFYSFASAARSA